MKDNGYKEILLKKIIGDETKKAAERLGHFNNLDSVCANKDLPPEEFLKVLEGVLRNVIGICESRLKNTFSRKERYANAEKQLTGLIEIDPTGATDESDIGSS